MGLSAEQEVLLREHAQAADACRANDTLIRAGLTIFVAAQAAVLAFLSNQRAAPSLALLLLEFLSMWVSAVVFQTTRRLHVRYKNYMDRARYIERRLEMYLYQYSYDYFGQHPVPPKWAGGNKKLWASVPIVTLALVAILFTRHSYLWLSCVLCGHCAAAP
jgi:hypothetical protein